jgi:hypothetical protein
MPIIDTCATHSRLWPLAFGVVMSMIIAGTSRGSPSLLDQYASRTLDLEHGLPRKLEDVSQDKDSRITPVPGTTAMFSGMYVTCEKNRVSMRFLGPEDVPQDTANLLEGYGDLNASLADCRLDNGTSIRVKAGYVHRAMAYGECGATPPLRLSIWINKHRSVSSLGYTNFCEASFVSSMSIDPTSVKYCLKDDAFSAGASKDVFKPNHGSCGSIALVAGTDPDCNEFPRRGVRLPLVGSISLKATGAIRAVCEKIIAQQGSEGLKTPYDAATPGWQKVDARLPQPDLSKFDNNATTLSEGDLLAADFDLANTGVVSKVYASGQENHWFDGSAFAIDRKGILVTPFDAHDWDASIEKGIYAFVYDHAQVFFFEGKTYLLLNRFNSELDPTVILLHDTTVSTVCTFNRRLENF